MKKIKVKKREERADYFCDTCVSPTPAVSHLKFTFGYGSSHDLTYFDIDFCEKCGEKLRKYLLGKYKVEVKEYLF